MATGRLCSVSLCLPAGTGHFLRGYHNVGNFSGISGPQSIAPFLLSLIASSLAEQEQQLP